VTVVVARFPGLTLTRYAGDCTEADVAAAVRDGQALERFATVRWSIHDFSACTSFRFDLHQAQEIALRDFVAARRNPALRIAAVTTRPDVSAFVWTYIATDVSRYPVIVLPTRAAALEWLEQQAAEVPAEVVAALAG
jgi:hypothetical protein